MSRGKRILLFALIAFAAAAVAAFFVDNGHMDRYFLLLALGSLLVILPCWLLLLPFVVISDNLRAWQPVVFALTGAAIASIVAFVEAHHFYRHAPPAQMPTTAWFQEIAWKSALLGAAACAAYLGILKGASRRTGPGSV
ncbi:hypothetical protein [Granulicella mallensis]|uniref:Transmembrane protein n=1 Tax=Granulicella mallensis (strain ATCC BAA-1857 / DSM 23137 / MP5ACTX8) TaxID=682795 RepID=G8NX24_GRAMM|nr:hypothetical protein [Granulicella mallensis]AEU35552.1 hypothetical protein AciX8_1208 [Granulicella mallensis MP5ACTX8]